MICIFFEFAFVKTEYSYSKTHFMLKWAAFFPIQMCL